MWPCGLGQDWANQTLETKMAMMLTDDLLAELQKKCDPCVLVLFGARRGATFTFCFLTDIFSQYTFIVGGRWHARAIALIQVRLQHSVSSGL